MMDGDFHHKASNIWEAVIKVAEDEKESKSSWSIYRWQGKQVQCLLSTMTPVILQWGEFILGTSVSLEFGESSMDPELGA